MTPAASWRGYAKASDSDKVAVFTGTKGNDGKFLVTLIEGDGIGPEISQSVKDIYSAANVRLDTRSADFEASMRLSNRRSRSSGNP